MKRHPLDVVGLTFAVLFLAATALWFVWETGGLSTTGLVITAPVVLIVLGIAGIFGTLPRRTARPATTWTAPADTGSGEDTDSTVVLDDHDERNDS